MKKIIGLSGFISSGKDTTAEYLEKIYNFKKISFAASLKDVISVVFGWDRQLLEGTTAESREWRIRVDEWWSRRLDIPDLTPRWVLQHWGTDLLRKHFHNDIWIASLENKIRSSDSDIVITDVRFPNEFSAIKNMGGIVVRVERGTNPEWYDLAIKANISKDQSAINYLTEKIHPSEWSIIGQDFDRIIDNNGSMGDLYLNIDHLIEDYPESGLLVSTATAKRAITVDNFCILFLD